MRSWWSTGWDAAGRARQARGGIIADLHVSAEKPRLNMHRSLLNRPPRIVGEPPRAVSTVLTRTTPFVPCWSALIHSGFITRGTTFIVRNYMRLFFAPLLLSRMSRDTFVPRASQPRGGGQLLRDNRDELRRDDCRDGHRWSTIPSCLGVIMARYWIDLIVRSIEELWDGRC